MKRWESARAKTMYRWRVGRFKGRWRLFSVETRLAASQAAALPENSLELNILPRSETGQAPSLQDICLFWRARRRWPGCLDLGASSWGCDRCSLELHSGRRSIAGCGRGSALATRNLKALSH